jgi:hypothetical protein
MTKKAQSGGSFSALCSRVSKAAARADNIRAKRRVLPQLADGSGVGSPSDAFQHANVENA